MRGPGRDNRKCGKSCRRREIDLAGCCHRRGSRLGADNVVRHGDPGAAWSFAGAVVIGAAALNAYTVFVVVVPPESGRRTYVVEDNGLAIEAGGERRTVRWTDIELVRHRPWAPGSRACRCSWWTAAADTSCGGC